MYIHVASTRECTWKSVTTPLILLNYRLSQKICDDSFSLWPLVQFSCLIHSLRGFLVCVHFALHSPLSLSEFSWYPTCEKGEEILLGQDGILILFKECKILFHVSLSISRAYFTRKYFSIPMLPYNDFFSLQTLVPLVNDTINM